MKPSESRVHKAQETIAFIANCFELLIAAIVIIAILISLTHVPEKDLQRSWESIFTMKKF